MQVKWNIHVNISAETIEMLLFPIIAPPDAGPAPGTVHPWDAIYAANSPNPLTRTAYRTAITPSSPISSNAPSAIRSSPPTASTGTARP